MKKSIKIATVLLICIIVCECAVIKLIGDTTIKVPTLWKSKTEEVYIYDGDQCGENLEAEKVINLESRLKIEDKIYKIVQELKEKFSDIEIEIIGYKNIGNKKILILDLRDKNKSVGSYLNAGSTGSRINLGIIVNSLLRNEKDIHNWIDGVKILVNGEENVEGEHISLAEIFYKTTDNTIDLQ